MELFAKRMTWELDNDEGLSCLSFELEDGYFTLSRKTGAEALRLEMNDPANGQLIDPDCFEYALDNTRFRLNIMRNNRNLLGLIPTAWVIGKIAEKDRSVPRLLLACFAGLAVLYLVGLPYIALIVNVYKGGNVSGMTLATAYMLPYLPGDCLKIVVSVILAPRILKAMERNS